MLMFLWRLHCALATEAEYRDVGEGWLVSPCPEWCEVRLCGGGEFI